MEKVTGDGWVIIFSKNCHPSISHQFFPIVDEGRGINFNHSDFLQLDKK
jgi:hypothetical protein